MKTIIFTALLAIFSVSAFAENTCSTVGAASCQTSEGMCFEYPVDSILNAEQLEGLCQGMSGIFSQSPCPAKFNKGKCVSNSNPYMAIILFDENFDLTSAEMFCSSMSGEFCN